MTWAEWVIDAAMTEPRTDGVACFCPIEGDIGSNDFNVVTGFSVMSDAPPYGTVVGIISTRDPGDVEPWCDRNAEWLEGLSARLTSNNPEATR